MQWVKTQYPNLFNENTWTKDYRELPEVKDEDIPESTIVRMAALPPGFFKVPSDFHESPLPGSNGQAFGVKEGVDALSYETLPNGFDHSQDNLDWDKAQKSKREIREERKRQEKIERGINLDELEQEEHER